MGRVKRDLYKQIDWLLVSYDQIEAIMGLIIHRAECDSPYDSTGTVLTEESYTYSGNVRAVYIDLDKMISETKLSYKQRYVIERLMLGFSLSDIAKEFNCNKRDILSILKTGAKKIQKTYHVKLINWLETSGRAIVKSTAKYKQCKVCGEIMNISNFSPDKKSEDGYRNVCKICRM